MFIPPPPREPDPIPAQTQPHDDVHLFAARKLDQGYNSTEVRELLVEHKKLTPEQARTVVSAVRSVVGNNANAKSIDANSLQEFGKRNMMFGAMWCIGGIVVTLGTLAAATGGGGSYMIAWGAILFGAIQFFRGASQMGTPGS